MSSKLATMRFPDGKTRYECSERTPVVGDVIRANGDAWRIAEVRENDDGALIVRLEAEANLTHPISSSLRQELFERAAEVRAASQQLRAAAVERRLRTQDERAKNDGSRERGQQGMTPWRV